MKRINRVHMVNNEIIKIELFQIYWNRVHDFSLILRNLAFWTYEILNNLITLRSDNDQTVWCVHCARMFISYFIFSSLLFNDCSIPSRLSLSSTLTVYFTFEFKDTYSFIYIFSSSFVVIMLKDEGPSTAVTFCVVWVITLF